MRLVYDVSQPVARGGVHYPSQLAFADAIGVHPSTVCLALKRGRLDTVGAGTNHNAKPCEVDGVKYATTRQAMAELGITWRALKKRIGEVK